jgi:hypothetical protein
MEMASGDIFGRLGTWNYSSKQTIPVLKLPPTALAVSMGQMRD